MDSEARLVPHRPRWTRSRGSSTWKGISTSPGPHQQGKVTAMSGHINTKSDHYVEVLGMQFSPDAAPSSANMNTDLRSSNNYLTCHLTKAACSCITSPGEGSIDRQSLFGRLDWWEPIANPSPLGSQNDSRAKWVGKTTFHQSSGATAFVEWSSAVYSKTSEIGVSDAPSGRSDLRRLNPLNDVSPAMTLSGMRRLIDSDGSPAFSLLVSHPCSYRRDRSVGAFSSVRRAGRLRIANGHAGNRVSDIHQGPLGCRGTNLSTFSTRVQARRVMSLQRPVPAFSDWNASRLDPQGVAVLTDEMSCPALSGPHKRTPSSGASRGTHGFLVPARDPWDSPTQATFRSGLRPLGKSAKPTPEPTKSDPQVLRFCQAGRLLPAPSGPHQQGPPYGVPWQQTGTQWFLATRRNLPWVPGQGRRDDPQAVFGRRACGERLANPTPASAVHLLNRSNT
jgi:hypothetical protein